MSDQAIDQVEPMRLLAELLTYLPPSTGTRQSLYWTDEEIGGAVQSAIARGVRRGWSWEPPLLVKGNVSRRPRTLMRSKTPADRAFNPATDAFVLRMGGRLVTSGKWAGYYELGDHYARHDGSFVDPDACPECQGAPWFVRLPRDPFDRQAVPQLRFGPCRRCVSGEELEDARYRRAVFEEKAAQAKAQRNRRRE